MAGYTSGFTETPIVPTTDKVKRLMTELKLVVPLVRKLEERVGKLLPIREKTLQVVSEAIEYLHKHHQNVNIAKVISCI